MYLVFNRIKRIINEKRLNTTSFLRKLKLRFSMEENSFNHFKPTFHCKKKWYGGSYGGFYVNPELLNEKSVVYSFGIGKDISFDKKVINKHKCKVFGFDPTPKSIDYIKTIAPPGFFHFNEYGISSKTATEKFFLPANEKGVSASMVLNESVNKENFIEAKMKSFDDITQEFNHQHIDLLKMDIEGAEYEVLATIINSKTTVTQLLVEFHDRFFEGEMKSKKTIELLNKHGFEIFAASLNFEEISFINTNSIPEKNTR